MKQMLVLPMALYVLYMWGFAVFMFRTRVRSIKTGQVSHKYFKTFAGDPPPERVVLIGQHYDNQFQVPLLFLITGVLFIALDAVNTATLILAWIFVASRLFHSWVHLGGNKLLPRAMSFALGWMMIGFMWLQLIFIALR